MAATGSEDHEPPLRRGSDYDLISRVARMEQTIYGTGEPDGTSIQSTMREVRDEQRDLREHVDNRLNRLQMIFIGALVTFGATATTLLLQASAH